MKPGLPESEGPAWRQPIRLPRWVVYFQAAMILVVAVTGFIYGLMVANVSGNRRSVSGGVDVRLVGRVILGAGNEAGPDAGAVVVALPIEMQPERRYASRSLNPKTFVALDNPVIEAIRAAGGDVVRANDDATFELFVSGPATFHLVVVSARRERATDGLTRMQRAELGVILTDPEAMVAGQAFQIQSIFVETPFYDVGTIRF